MHTLAKPTSTWTADTMATPGHGNLAAPRHIDRHTERQSTLSTTVVTDALAEPPPCTHSYRETQSESEGQKVPTDSPKKCHCSAMSSTPIVHGDQSKANEPTDDLDHDFFAPPAADPHHADDFHFEVSPMSAGTRRAMRATVAMVVVSLVCFPAFIAYHQYVMPAPAPLEGGAPSLPGDAAFQGVSAPTQADQIMAASRPSGLTADKGYITNALGEASSTGEGHLLTEQDSALASDEPTPPQPTGPLQTDGSDLSPHEEVEQAEGATVGEAPEPAALHANADDELGAQDSAQDSLGAVTAVPTTTKIDEGTPAADGAGAPTTPPAQAQLATPEVSTASGEGSQAHDDAANNGQANDTDPVAPAVGTDPAPATGEPKASPTLLAATADGEPGSNEDPRPPAGAVGGLTQGEPTSAIGNNSDTNTAAPAPSTAEGAATPTTTS